MNSSIVIHGREGYTALIKSIVDGSVIDLSAATVYFEIPSVNLRARLPADPVETTSLRLTLERSEVEKLSTSPSEFAIIDETGLPVVIKSGTIQRNGYKGEPK
ncbi:hypothetical protein [Sphingomonas sp. CFBP 13706]|uniref:hypothetical protein n=1 Tax=Sphingomonas sp. CFBP 13706 TaxID=2775314 RepID=UPI00177F4522|nr:hypothetical protein [Sphingomonas sp. CFBP 13706]MBD8734881.1 hypothetical protein [Sphingomonas sp. CFBP 13706]